MGQIDKVCKSILIIEDDYEIRNTLRELLEIEGYQAYAASNGKEGLDLLPRLGSPCLVLLDLMMPIMDGWEFLKAKGQLKVAPIPVVIISAIDRETGTPAGAVHFVKKPIEVDTLLEVIRHYCGMPLQEVGGCKDA